MVVIEHVMLVCTDARSNNNKFWEGILYDNGDVWARWGRVGTEGEQGYWPGRGRAYFDSKLREKERKNYTRVSVISGTAPGADKAVVKQVATEQIYHTDPIVTHLIERLVEENRHQIVELSGGRIDVDAKGMVKTEVGVIDACAIKDARHYLAMLVPHVTLRHFDNPAFIDALNEYLMRVPQKVGARRGWHHHFITCQDDLIRQSSFLDQLESSIDLAAQAAQKANIPNAPVFDVRLALIEDPRVLVHVKKRYTTSLNRQHVSAGLKIVRIYEITIASMQQAFVAEGKKLGTIWELWHGTRTHNVLSILKRGMIVPKSGGSIQVTGRHFGDGLYFSDQSSKAANYSYGFWDRQGYAPHCFVFLADVAMGRYHVPKGGITKLPRGYDSCFAKAGESSVLNNEMVVYRTCQANPRYLVELSK